MMILPALLPPDFWTKMPDKWLTLRSNGSSTEFFRILFDLESTGKKPNCISCFVFESWSAWPERLDSGAFKTDRLSLLLVHLNFNRVFWYLKCSRIIAMTTELAQRCSDTQAVGEKRQSVEYRTVCTVLYQVQHQPVVSVLRFWTTQPDLFGPHNFKNSRGKTRKHQFHQYNHA